MTSKSLNSILNTLFFFSLLFSVRKWQRQWENIFNCEMYWKSCGSFHCAPLRIQSIQQLNQVLSHWMLEWNSKLVRDIHFLRQNAVWSWIGWKFYCRFLSIRIQQQSPLITLQLAKQMKFGWWMSNANRYIVNSMPNNWISSPSICFISCIRWMFEPKPRQTTQLNCTSNVNWYSSSMFNMKWYSDLANWFVDTHLITVICLMLCLHCWCCCRSVHHEFQFTVHILMQWTFAWIPIAIHMNAGCNSVATIPFKTKIVAKFDNKFNEIECNHILNANWIFLRYERILCTFENWLNS